MQTRGRELFANVSVEGAILPPDLLRRVLDGDKGLDGLSPDAYHLSGEKLGEAVSRSWVKLRAAWTAFAAAREKLPASDAGTTLTREKWLLPLFQELGYGRLAVVKPEDVCGKTYDISHGWRSVPIHLVTFRADLNRRAVVTGAQRSSPHGLVQEYLNRSEGHMWGFVSNGLQLRILRDNASLTRQAFVEFDLAAIMQGEAYSDFALLWLLCHQSRVEADRPEEFWLEKWSRAAQADGTRALDALRQGVERAIEALGVGFLAHPANGAIRDSLRSGAFRAQDYYRQLLRLVYRMLFLFVAEDRDLLLLPSADGAARTRFHHYSTRRLRMVASRVPGTPHADTWAALRLIMDKLGDDAGCPELGLPALGSFLWSKDALGAIATAEIANRHLLDAVRAISFTDDGRSRRWVDYKNLGAEELGSVYESLLELVPTIDTGTGAFSLVTASGNERKTTGSYYTPKSLVSCLLDSALNPVLDEAAGKPDAGKAILALKVVDPACGSGHFLIAAAHRIARRLAVARAGSDEPAPPDVRHALRDVIGHCIYGVDINPMAVELCKVALWMEALEPGKPLSFLDSKIRCGNALIGTAPSLIAKGLPDEAFDPIEGDVKKVASAWKKRNKAEREGQTDLFGGGAILAAPEHLTDAVECAEALPEDSIIDVRRKAEALGAAEASEEAARARLVADLWCAAFVQRKANDQPITTETLRRLSSPGATLAPTQLAEVARQAEQYRFFHWHLAFPQVLQRMVASPGLMGWHGGFDVVLGNPPWERVKLQEQEFFASRNGAIAGAANASARKRLIAALPATDPALWAAWSAASREAEGQSHFVRHSDRFPLCGKGDVNTYALFAEHNWGILNEKGRAGFIVPTGIATDDTTKEYFGALMSSRNLAALYGFENEGKLFKGIDHRVNFCLLVLSRPEIDAPNFAAFIREPSVLREADRVYQLTAADLSTLNPNTGTCPVFRTRRDARMNLEIYRRSGVLWRDGAPDGNPWKIRFMAMLHMANDSGLFRTRAELEASGHRLVGNRFEGPNGACVPLIEAKMIYNFNHRFGDFALLEPGEREHILPQAPDVKLARADYLTTPRYWVAQSEVESKLAGTWQRGWLLGWRDVTDARSSVRTVVASFIPRVAVGDKFLLMMPAAGPQATASLCANLCSFAFDYCARQKVGGISLKYFTMKQLPALKPATYEEGIPWSPVASAGDWILPRVLELTYTAWDLEPFGRDVGYDGPPFRWDPDRRAVLRAELDAAFFHLYGISREDSDYILNTFPIVRKNDERAHGEFRTKRLVLERYDAMAEAQRTGKTYQTPLDPPPADPRVAHPRGGKQRHSSWA